MTDEYNALLNNNTWKLVPLPPDRTLIGCKWIFRTKYNPDGSILKYKARLVAKGFHQQEGFDYHETFSPVVKPVTIQIIISVALSKGWPIHQLDVNNAFINGDLHEEVFLQQPPGFFHTDKTLVSPNKGPIWTQTGSSSQVITNIIQSLHTTFALKDLGQLHYFLGIEATKTTTGGYHLHQTKYIQDLIQRAKMENCKPVPSPMAFSIKLTSTDGSTHPDPTQYRSIVGALQYATITRPDITFSVNKVCQYMHHPLDTHWKAVKRILRYLNGTTSHGLTIHPLENFHLTAYCDSDWASDLDDRRSTSGICIFFGSNLVNWSSKKQTVVSRLSTEAEYRSLASTITELSWTKSLLSEIQVPLPRSPTIYCDNLSTVQLSANPVFLSRTKHFDLDLYFVREQVVSKAVSVHHIPVVD
ncbi:uncharacterized mitochondrial protein AtMg00810-like [Gastrolobium bilobum]|uniref:uncharacterized mitochondrial protein AtMg00810-like n=1 Tax=Gastrolobium bilobum TaxID=150636 RepID=UPI002AB238F0|nr:uncharacterized mitochondrial protein AtMg00810-like [Gastrolobium bilobum]